MAVRKVVVFLALVLCAAANVESEVKNERGDIDYRVAFKTADLPPAWEKLTPAQKEKKGVELTSSGKFTIEIIGEDGTSTGPQELIDHPSQVQLGESGEWKPKPGMIQVARLTAANVGEIKEIKIEGNNKDKWYPSWIKVNSNDFHTGKGNGIYYSTLRHEGISLGEGYSVSTET